MSVVRSSDPDFRICLVDFNTLLEIQSDAERLGSATRWTSVDALRGQAREQDAVLQTLMREKRAGVIRSYRCLHVGDRHARVAGQGGRPRCAGGNAASNIFRAVS